MDGSGKTTVSKNICEILNKKKIPCFWSKEPTDFPTGLKIRKFLKGEMNLDSKEQIDAFLEDRQVSVSENILPNLNRGTSVILDRYYYSTAAYQSSDEFPAKTILNLNLEKKFPIPDLIIYLDIPPEVSLKRIENRLQEGEDKERFETLALLAKIRKAYAEVIPHNAFLVDAELPEDQVSEICLERILDLF